MFKRRLLKAFSRSIPPRDFENITSTTPEDVFIVGYPKSGNTWMGVLCSSLIYGLNPQKTPDTLTQELVPDVHYKTFYKRFQEPCLFKSHHLPRPEYKRVIQIVRDGRDVMCSLKHFNDALGKVHTFDKMINDAAGLTPCRWHEHILAWNKNPYDADILLVKYEDLKADCVQQLKRIAEFINIECSDAEFATIAEATQVKNMKKREQKFGWNNKDWPKDKAFVRQGTSGGFRSELDEQQVTQFDSLSAEALHLLGYSLNNEIRDSDI